MKIPQIVIVSILITMLPYGALAQTTASPFRAGAAKVDITPAQLPKNSEGILDHIYARAIVIDNGATSAALFSADVGMLGEQMWKTVSQRIEKELGIPAQNLFMNPTHTHSASGGSADQIFNTIKAAEENLLPIGLAEGCRLKHDIPKDQVLTYSDIELPKGRLCDKLRQEQNSFFSLPRAQNLKAS